MSIIEVNHVTKEYRLGQMKSLKQSVLGAIDRLRGRPTPKQDPFKALDDVDFKVEEGEVLGIIGTNGAGKSTLLKLLARVSVPTKGEINVRGSVAPLIEVGAGLHPEMTGRENIFLNGSIMGLPRAVIKEKYDEIVEFAELEEFIDTPIKRYSSGMMIRLGFSIATSVDADILIIDEVLAVGDLAFQRKCFDRMENLIKGQGKTVLLVSHNIRQVERLCTRVILLNQGKILADDNPTEVCNLFYERSDKKIKQNILAAAQGCVTTNEVELLKVSMLSDTGEEIDTVQFMSCPTFVFSLKVNSELLRPTFVVGIHTTDFVYIATHRSSRVNLPIKMQPGVYEVKCRMNNLPILPGVYSLRLCIDVGKLCTSIFYAENIYHFNIQKDGFKRSESEAEGFLSLETDWQVTANMHDATIGSLHDFVQT